MFHRLLAVLGALAFGIRRFADAILSLVGLHAASRFAVPALVIVLGAGAVLSARDTAAVLGDRPVITEATLGEVAAYDGEGGSIWFTFDALVDETHLATQAGPGSFFYLARDPADPATGLIVRSSRNDAFFRQRVIGATVVDDPDLVADALEHLGPLPTGFELDRQRFLDEVESGGDPADAFAPSELEEEPSGENVLVTGRIVSPDRFATCAEPTGCEGADAAYLYLFADADSGAAMVLRSPHPPSALPVRLEGLFLRDSFDLATVADSTWFKQLETDAPTNRALFAGSRPPITVEASWVPTIVYGLAALVLLASHLVGYPVFGAGGRPSRRRTLRVGEGLDMEMTGRLAREGRTLELHRSPVSLERVSIRELALRMWRYGLLPRDLSRREAERQFLEQSAGETDRLVINERDQSTVVVLDRDGAVEVDAGRLYRIVGSVPAIHLRQDRTDGYLAARSDEERDRAASEIAAEASTR